MGFLSDFFGIGGSGKSPGTGTDPAPAGEKAAQSGLSWGDTMPEEENQYNYPGDYRQYFEHIFRDDFPEFHVEKELVRNKRGTVYAFRREGGIALIVELMNESSSAQRIRKVCGLRGVPYLRFYYDHHGWWNTRSYVTGRIRKALESA